MELIETGYPFLEVQQFTFVVGGYDDVEIEVVESGMAALLIDEVRNILLHHAGHGAAVAVFDRRRSLQDQARDVGHLEDIVRGDEHRVRVDLRLDQADHVFNDCANGFQFRFLRLKRTFPLDTYRSRPGSLGAAFPALKKYHLTLFCRVVFFGKIERRRP